MRSSALQRGLPWRAEETCFNAWPALREVMFRDWCLRFSEGLSRRANSANPLRPHIRDVDASIGACESLYRVQGMPVLFRILSIIEPAVDNRLERLGYLVEGETLTLYGDIEAVPAERHASVEIRSHPSPEWLEAMGGFQNHAKTLRDTYRRIVESIVIPAAFLAHREEGEITALAYGAVHDGLLCCESVITGARHRGRGYARRALESLFGWARGSGVSGVCLQVEATNLPAIALYRSLGLSTELYRYHYRREPADSA